MYRGFGKVGAAPGIGGTLGTGAVRERVGSVSFRVVGMWSRRSGENRSPSQGVDSGLRRNDGENWNDGETGMTGQNWNDAKNLNRLIGNAAERVGCVSFRVVRVVWVWIRRSGENRSPSQGVDSGLRRNDGWGDPV